MSKGISGLGNAILFYFVLEHFNKCNLRKTDQKDNGNSKQLTLFNCFTGSKRKADPASAGQENGAGKKSKDVPLQIIDSDIDESDCEKEM